jgi:hypothetical protein
MGDAVDDTTLHKREQQICLITRYSYYCFNVWYVVDR